MEMDGSAKKGRSLIIRNTDGVSTTPTTGDDVSRPSANKILYGVEEYPPWHICTFLALQVGCLTRKLCYRKDYRTMRPILKCPENFRDSLTTHTVTILNIFHGLLFRSIL